MEQLTVPLTILIKLAAEMALKNPVIEVYPLTGKSVKHKIKGNKLHNVEVVSYVPDYLTWYSIVYEGVNSAYAYNLRTSLEACELLIMQMFSYPFNVSSTFWEMSVLS